MGGLLHFSTLLLTGAFAGERLFGASLVAGLEIERVLLDVLDDVFLLDLPLEAPQSTLNGLAFLNLDFSHGSNTPSPVRILCRPLSRAAGQHRRVTRALPAEVGQSSLKTSHRIGAVKILVLGSGGREHALVWRLGRDADVTSLIAAPGNPGISTLCRCIPLDILQPDDVLALAEREGVDLTVVGPEAPLERGLADLFRRRGRPILGPTKLGAALECSKVWSKQFMTRYRIPTANFLVADDLAVALDAVSGARFGFPVVVKADGLAAGKGVVIAETRDQAERAVRTAMVDRAFGESGARLVIEECLTGPEISAFYLCDGQRAISLSSAQDHKRIWDDDRGPNTGGMGAFAPSPLMTADLATATMRHVVEPVLAGMRAEGEPYIGFLYVSLMLTPDGPKVIEFNARFGDPEAQVVFPLIEGPFASALLMAANGQLDRIQISVGTGRSVGVVLASRGYPASRESGQPIYGLDRASAEPHAFVFQAGTSMQENQLVTAGGRVLTAVGQGATYREAMATAYRVVSSIAFDGMQFRRDIGRKAVTFDGRKAEP
jgi:phosphoribosylamine---glycine ligase